LASGGAAGASSLLFVYSLDFARTRLANDAKSTKKGGGERQFNGLLDVYRKTWATDGIAGLYRGFVISCVGIVVYRGLFFGLYDSLKPVLLTGSLANNFFASFALGWAVTTGAGLASYPLDTVRRRMMMTSGEAVKYRSSMHCLTEVVKNEGIKSLFKGAGANVLRAVAGAGVLSGYDKMQEMVFGKVSNSDIRSVLVLTFLNPGLFFRRINDSRHKRLLTYIHIDLFPSYTIFRFLSLLCLLLTQFGSIRVISGVPYNILSTASTPCMKL